MSKDQPYNQRDPNSFLDHGGGRTTDEFAHREGEHLYPHLPSYSEVPSTHPVYMQYNHPGTESYVPPWYNGNGNTVQDTGVPQGSRFGLIRGYHQQMYEQNQNSLVQCCDCTSQTTKPFSEEAKFNWGIIFGLLLIILGVFALVMGFTLPQKNYSYSERLRLSPQDKKEADNTDFYIEIFILSGLSVLSLGGIVVSLGILYPVCRRGRDEHDDSMFNKYYGSEVYVKEEQIALPGHEGDQKTLVNFGFHKNVVPTDVSLRKVQPERQKSEPIEANNSLFK